MKKTNPLILAINPGSTSTKLAMFAGRSRRWETEIKHDAGALAKLPHVIAQDDLRRATIVKAMRERQVEPADIDVFVGRGGLLRPLHGGVYEVNERMLEDLRLCKYGEHASNLGAMLAAELGQAAGKKAYIANPVVVDELSDTARLTGLPELPRRTIFHALSQKAVAGIVARRLGRPYEKCNLIVAHIGGGLSIGAHRHGKVVDVNNSLDGEGPFTPERTGALPLMPFLKLAQERKWTVAQAYKQITRGSGLLAHLGTNDCRLIEDKVAAGDAKFSLVYEAFIYGIAKHIGAMAAALKGKVDAIVLTGGVVRGAIFVRKLREYVGFIAPVRVVAKNSEMAALACAALEAHCGQCEVGVY